jgi:hypothetical protein
LICCPFYCVLAFFFRSRSEFVLSIFVSVWLRPWRWQFLFWQLSVSIAVVDKSPPRSGVLVLVASRQIWFML